MRKRNVASKQKDDGAVEFIRPAGATDAARRVEEIIAAIPREIANIEILKHTIRRERGAYAIALSVDREGGVDTVLCESISRFIANRLDAASPPIGNYSLEVASAGLDRPLLTPAHFGRFVGRDARIITHERIANRVEFTGNLESANDERIVILDRYAGRVEIPHRAIKRAHLAYEPSRDLKRKST